jgi:hypothetical protein
MRELNDHPEQSAEPQNTEPHDAPWPDDTPATGDAAVDSALGRLAAVPSVPVAEHSAIYAEIHDSLMASLDEER